jgi:hypothetical protein
VNQGESRTTINEVQRGLELLKAAAANGDRDAAIWLAEIALQTVGNLIELPSDLKQSTIGSVAQISFMTAHYLDWLLRHDADSALAARVRLDAQMQPLWPVLTRKGFENDVVAKLGIGRAFPLRTDPYPGRRPPDYNTGMTRVCVDAIREIEQLRLVLFYRTDESERSTQHRERALKETIAGNYSNLLGEDVEQLMELVRKSENIPKLELGSANETVKAWTKLLSSFLLIVDPGLKDADPDRPGLLSVAEAAKKRRSGNQKPSPGYVREALIRQIEDRLISLTRDYT